MLSTCLDKKFDQTSSNLKWINSDEIPTSKQEQKALTAEQQTTLLHIDSHYGQKENTPYILSQEFNIWLIKFFTG